MLHVEFISSYQGQSDYDVYVRRLGRDVRVRRVQSTGEYLPMTAEVTPAEATECLAAVEAYLAKKHAEFLAYCAERGLDANAA